jgi:hypothetical protein
MPGSKAPLKVNKASFSQKNYFTKHFKLYLVILNTPPPNIKSGGGIPMPTVFEPL